MKEKEDQVKELISLLIEVDAYDRKTKTDLIFNICKLNFLTADMNIEETKKEIINILGNGIDISQAED